MTENKLRMFCTLDFSYLFFAFLASFSDAFSGDYLVHSYQTEIQIFFLTPLLLLHLFEKALPPKPFNRFLFLTKRAFIFYFGFTTLIY